MKKIFLFLSLSFFAAGCTSGVGETVKFQKPDIKDDFCGVEINFQYCKCAFHDEYCDAIGMDKRSANSYVRSEYKKWLNEKLLAFETACKEGGGIFKKNKCTYCEEGFEALNDSCVEVALAEQDEESGEGGEFIPDGPLANDCSIIPDQFESEWKKYSDIDERLAFDERSFESKQALTAYDEMVELMVEGFELERDYELERQMIDELEAYRQALVQNIKTNLLKAFWRLSWVTYKTIESGAGLGGSYNTLLTTGSTVEAIGSGLKVVQGVVPADSSLAIDTSTVSGKARSVGANAALEAINSLGDPVKIATEVFTSASNASLPSADLTPEEINILRDQHINKGVIDAILSESRTANENRQARMSEIESEIAELRETISGWEAKEKERVRIMLEESCKELKKQFEEQK